MKDIDFEIENKEYHKAFLKQNPFPATAVPESRPHITADRDDAKEMFVNIVNGVLQDGESAVAIFIGDWGSGKSHILRVFHTSIEDKLNYSKGGIYPILVSTPGRNFLDFTKEIFNGVGRTRIVELANKIIEEYIQQNKAHVKNLVFKEYKEKFENNDYNLEDLLENIQIINLIKEIRYKFEFVRDDDFLHALLYTAQKSSRIIAWNWLIGTMVSVEDKKSMQIISSNDEVNKSKTILKDLVDVIKSLGYKGIVFFVDEFENISVIPSNQRKIYQDDIRNIIDEFTKNVAIFFAITPTAWKDFESEPTALTRRLRSNQLMLKRFGEKDIRELIADFLKSQRSENMYQEIKSTFSNCEEKFAPFTKDAIDVILSESEGIVSEILELCRKSINKFVSSKNDEINSEFVKELIN